MKFFLEKHIIGGQGEEQLPIDRKHAFGFYFKQQFWKLLFFGIFAALFFTPLLVWLYAMNFSKAQAMATLDPSAADYVKQYGELLVGWTAKTYGVAVLLFGVGFVGLCGLFSVVKRICFYQSSGYGEFFVGIKQNCIHFVLWGLMFGLSLFFLRFNVVFYNVSKLNPFVKGLLVGFSVGLFVIVSIATMYFVTGDVTYRCSFGQSFKNAFLLAFNGMFKNLLFVVVGLAPFVAALLVPSPFQVVVLAVLGLIYLSALSMFWTCYCQSVFDKVINPQLGTEFVGKGLAKKVDNN